MSHSLYSYLRRRTTEELEAALQLCMEDNKSDTSREMVKQTLQILYERGVHLSQETLEQLDAILTEDSCL